VYVQVMSTLNLRVNLSFDGTTSGDCASGFIRGGLLVIFVLMSCCMWPFATAKFGIRSLENHPFLAKRLPKYLSSML
jgi:hypothetical protein